MEEPHRSGTAGESRVERRRRADFARARTRRKGSVRPRTALAAIAVALAALSALAAWWILRPSPDGSVRLDVPPPEATRAVFFAGAFPAEKDSPLASPLGIARIGDRLFVAEADAGSIGVFSLNGGRRGRIEVPSAPGAARAYPASIASVDAATLAVVDTEGRRALMVPAEASDRPSVTLLQPPESRAASPQPIAVAAGDGVTFVADAAERVIHTYTRQGEYLGSLGEGVRPRLTFAGGMAYREGELFVTDSKAGRVVVLDAKKGRLLRVLPRRMGLPIGVAFLGPGRAAVCDDSAAAVRILDDGGSAVAVADTHTGGIRRRSELARPKHAVYVPSSRRMYVTDPSDGRVRVFVISGE